MIEKDVHPEEEITSQTWLGLQLVWEKVSHAFVIFYLLYITIIVTWCIWKKHPHLSRREWADGSLEGGWSHEVMCHLRLRHFGDDITDVISYVGMPPNLQVTSGRIMMILRLLGTSNQGLTYIFSTLEVGSRNWNSQNDSDGGHSTNAWVAYDEHHVVLCAVSVKAGLCWFRYAVSKCTSARSPCFTDFAIPLLHKKTQKQAKRQTSINIHQHLSSQQAGK